jgi:GxxExxY protein
MGSLVKENVIYPELSYQIVGVLFSVFNTLGYGYKEKYYQRAISQEFSRLGLKFKEQVNIPVKFNDKIIGRQVMDFLVDDKIILEIKRGNRFSKNDIIQVTGYLKTANLKLAILARFSSKNLIFKRVVNIK